MSDICRNCGGKEWVCENHQDRPWSVDGCECGAGAPCPICQWDHATAGVIGSALWPDELRAEADRRESRSTALATAERDAYRRGQEAMRERAAKVVKDHSEVARKNLAGCTSEGHPEDQPIWSAIVAHIDIDYDRIRALPVEEG